MHEEIWQRLVVPALVRSMELRAEGFYFEVPVRDGSRADLVYVGKNRLIAFEMVMAEAGEALAKLGSRKLRQLRHYGQACHSVYLVTVGAPRGFALSPAGDTVVLEPLERQLLPDGVGWVAFDRLSIDATVLVPAAERVPRAEDRAFLVDHLRSRLGIQRRLLQAHRA